MKITSKDLSLDSIGLGKLKNLHINCSNEELVEDILLNGEGVVGLNGAAMVDTGKFTGRSPKDRYIVDETTSNESIWWGEVNKKISENIDLSATLYYQPSLNEYEDDFKASIITSLDFMVNENVKISLVYSGFYDSAPPMNAIKHDEKLTTNFSYSF